MMQPVVLQAPPTPSSRVIRYKTQTSYILGGFQLALGIICIILNIVGIVVVPDYGVNLYISSLFRVGHGIWSGAFFIVTGSMGLGAGYSRYKCLIISFMVLSIISAAFFVPVMVAVSSSVLDKEQFYSRFYGYHIQKLVGLHASLLTFALLELIVAVISAVFCCRAVCCGASTSQQGQAVYMQTSTGGQQVIIVPQGSIQSGGQQFVIQPATAQYVMQPQDGMRVAHQPSNDQPTTAEYVVQSQGGVAFPPQQSSLQYVVEPQGGVAVAPPPYSLQPGGTQVIQQQQQQQGMTSVHAEETKQEI